MRPPEARPRDPGTLGAELLAVGETMAMVAPLRREALEAAVEFRVDAGGAESNVAAHVASLGHSAGWFSRLGDDALGHRVAGQLAQRGVNVASVIFDSTHPTGVYFKDPLNGVSYYRAGSAASRLSVADAEGVGLLGVRILHVSGITAAISASAAAFLDRIMRRATEEGVLVSFDVNYRAALWDLAIAAPALAALACRADLVFTGRDEAQNLWATANADDVRAHFTQVPHLVVKDGDVGATAFVGDERFDEPSHVVDVVDVVDAVGAGDAFAGAYLAAMLDGAEPAACLRAGHNRAALTLRTTSDSIDEKARQ